MVMMKMKMIVMMIAPPFTTWWWWCDDEDEGDSDDNSSPIYNIIMMMVVMKMKMIVMIIALPFRALWWWWRRGRLYWWLKEWGYMRHIPVPADTLNRGWKPDSLQCDSWTLKMVFIIMEKTSEKLEEPKPSTKRVFSCPGQLNKWHCLSVGRIVCRSQLTIRAYKASKSDPRH